MNHPGKTQPRRYSQSKSSDWIFPNPVPAPPRRWKRPPARALLRGYGREMIPDAVPETPRQALMRVASRLEMLRLTCGETPGSSLPDSPDNLNESPVERAHISPAGDASLRSAIWPTNMVSTGAGWTKKSGMYWRPADKPVPQHSPHHPQSKYGFLCAWDLALAAHLWTKAGHPSCSVCALVPLTMSAKSLILTC